MELRSKRSFGKLFEEASAFARETVSRPRSGPIKGRLRASVRRREVLHRDDHGRHRPGPARYRAGRDPAGDPEGTARLWGDHALTIPTSASRLAALARGTAGVRGRTLIINLPLAPQGRALLSSSLAGSHRGGDRTAHGKTSPNCLSIPVEIPIKNVSSGRRRQHPPLPDNRDFFAALGLLAKMKNTAVIWRRIRGTSAWSPSHRSNNTWRYRRVCLPSTTWRRFHPRPRFCRGPRFALH